VEPHHPESPGPDSLFLIDFGCPQGFRAVGCAKFIHRASAHAADMVDASHNAWIAQISAQNCPQRKIPPQQKPLFHHIFLDLCNACTR